MFRAAGVFAVTGDDSHNLRAVGVQPPDDHLVGPGTAPLVLMTSPAGRARVERLLLAGAPGAD